MVLKIRKVPLTEETKAEVIKLIQAIDPEAEVDWSEALLNGVWFVKVKSSCDKASLRSEIWSSVDRIGSVVGLNLILS